MPRVSPLVIGHRGAPGYRPEHSASSYELALALGVDAVEPDVVASKDGVLVVRHENEISGTTDVADRPEFTDRRTTKRVDGQTVTGWFTEDFTWGELATLHCRERLPGIRPTSATFDDRQPILRLDDVLEIVRTASREQGREIGVVLEIKHATYFADHGLDLVPLVADTLQRTAWEGPLYIEAFESTVLTRLREHGIRGTYIYLIEAKGRPYDLVRALGKAAPTYRDTVEPAGLDGLAGRFDGISVSKSLILDAVAKASPDAGAHANAEERRMPHPRTLIDDAHARGLAVFTWTCRPENTFLARRFRADGGPAAFGDYEVEWSAIAATGVDGVFVDHPDLGVEFFRR